MANTTARIKKTGKNFEIIVDLDDALKFKKGLSEFIQAETEFIFKDIKKGEKASEKELKDAFGTTDVNEIVKKIVKEGEIQTTQEYRDAEQERNDARKQKNWARADEIRNMLLEKNIELVDSKEGTAWKII